MSLWRRWRRQRQLRDEEGEMVKRLLRAHLLPWRVGRKVGRTIYAVVGDRASDHDLLIGVMDTRELAEAAVRAHNADLV
jgi:hypothetical protein